MFSILRTSAIIGSLGLNLAACSTRGQHAAPPVHTARACDGGRLSGQVDARRFVGCERVRGDVAVEGTELGNLEALAGVREVSGTLAIVGNSNLENVRGLEGLKSVGTLRIEHNVALGSLAHLESLNRVSRIEVENAPSLKDLRGLEGLEDVDVLVVKNTGVCAATGLENLRDVGRLEITGNRLLISLHALNGLSRAQSIHLEQNPRLAAQFGLLPNVSIERSLVVEANVGLAAHEVARLFSRLRSDTPAPVSFTAANP